MRYLKGFVWAVLFLAGTVKCQPQAPAPTRANQADAVAERIAKGHFPEELRDPADPDNTGDCTAVYEIAEDGTPTTIFAVYPEAMHGVSGEMWVFLKGAGDQYTALPITPANFDFDAADCAITMIDGGPARRQHIMVSLGGEKSSREFIFSWDGHRLTSIGPTVRSGKSVVAGLTEAQVIHVYQGGTPAVLSEEAGTNGDSDEDETAIYRFDGRRYVREGLAIATEMIVCGPRSCAGQSPTGTFSVEAASRGPYVLRVGNGDSRGQNRVSGIRIAINEVDVFRDRDLTATTDALAVPLSKLRVGTNKISVQVEPRADHGAGKIAVLIEDLGPGR